MARSFTFQEERYNRFVLQETKDLSQLPRNGYDLGGFLNMHELLAMSQTMTLQIVGY